MSFSNRSKLSTALVLTVLAIGLAGCATTAPEPPPPPPPQVTPTLPPSFPPQDLVGSWGLAAYHKDEDRERTEKAAANQCRQPYIIILGATGGVMMHLADQATPTELRVKGAPGNKNFIGPDGEPPGSIQDREVVQFDGRVLILRWMDPEVQGRYGTMVYVRCPPEGGKRHKSRARAKTKPKPKAKPALAPKPVHPPIQRR
ncbi:MAG: hypothetical protein K9G60_11470 [Pseudolabrys sp.]|nr:hypothetical protein [Pseudolabrys sp.]